TVLPPQTISAFQGATSTGSASGQAFGAFVGYNIQFEDVVVGVEVDYTRQNATRSTSVQAVDFVGTTATATIFGPPGLYSVSRQVGSAAVNVSDYMTIRGRAGWDLGYFMPFATAGLAIGRGTESSQYTALACPGGVPGCGSPTLVNLAWRRPVTVAGLAFGAGVDIRVARYLLLRAEYQGVSFPRFGTGPVTIHTARVGAGLRF
ncbi:MAG: outer membrane protein, partial [Phreatobacter sp.]